MSDQGLREIKKAIFYPDGTKSNISKGMAARHCAPKFIFAPLVPRLLFPSS